jgi:hypothetical protein
MWEKKCKVPHGRSRPAHLSAPKSPKPSAKQSNQRPAGGLMPAYPRSAGKREIIVSRLWRFSPLVLGILAAAPLAPASGQNLDAGKPASQIFAEVCANCHRSARELRGNPGTSFLREHYTTGSDMASIMSAYLSSAGSDPRGAGASQPKRQPNAAAPVPPASVTTTTREPAADPSREPRRGQQTGDPKAAPASPGPTRGRPASARADGTAEIKPPALPASVPPRPALEEFEE